MECWYGQLNIVGTENTTIVLGSLTPVVTMTSSKHHLHLLVIMIMSSTELTRCIFQFSYPLPIYLSSFQHIELCQLSKMWEHESNIWRHRHVRQRPCCWCGLGRSAHSWALVEAWVAVLLRPSGLTRLIWPGLRAALTLPPAALSTATVRPERPGSWAPSSGTAMERAMGWICHWGQ